MTQLPASHGTAQTPARPVRVIDVDVHHQITNWQALAPFAPEGLRHRIARPSGPPLARHGFKLIGPRFGSAPRPIEGNGTLGQPAADPAWVKTAYLEAYGVDIAILTGPVLSLGVQPNHDMAAAIATAVNSWTLETWVRPYACFKGSILVAHQDPAQAVAEIDRLGDEPGMVQVLMGSASETPLGRRQYHPIYEACVRHGLPLALHIGGEGAGMSPPATAVGHPTTHFEWYGSLPQVYMAHIMSMVTEGVFEKFPTLKVVLYEGGLFWLPHIMWRFDKNWKAQRAETPWVKKPPSAYIREHFYHTSYPLEASDEQTLAHVLAMVDGSRTLLFAGNYPNWELGSPYDMIEALPETARKPVLAGNALDVYGARLLQPHGGV